MFRSDPRTFANIGTLSHNSIGATIAARELNMCLLCSRNASICREVRSRPFVSFHKWSWIRVAFSFVHLVTHFLFPFLFSGSWSFRILQCREASFQHSFPYFFWPSDASSMSVRNSDLCRLYHSISFSVFSAALFLCSLFVHLSFLADMGFVNSGEWSAYEADLEQHKFDMYEFTDGMLKFGSQLRLQEACSTTIQHIYDLAKVNLTTYPYDTIENQTDFVFVATNAPTTVWVFALSFHLLRWLDCFLWIALNEW